METLAENATGGIVMAPRLRTQLIAPQESAQWISDEPPGNPSPCPILLLCSKPCHTTVPHIHSRGQIL